MAQKQFDEKWFESLDEVLKTRRVNFKVEPVEENNLSNLEILEIVVSELDALRQTQKLDWPPHVFARLVRLGYVASLKDDWGEQVKNRKKKKTK